MAFTLESELPANLNRETYMQTLETRETFRPSGLAPFLRVRSISKRFGEREVLRHLDLSVQEGEMVAIVGKSGCGKSTLLRLLAGLERPTEGTISVDCDLVNGRNRSARLMFQESALILFDEPLGALDALTRLEMQNLIEKLWQQRGFTAILVTHDVEEAVALADRVLLMQHGEFRHESLVSLLRPRDRAGAEFAALKAEILSRVLAE